MADAILLGVVAEGVLSKVLSLANEEISGVMGVRKDLQSLAGKLGTIQDLISDAESKSTTSKTADRWLKNLEDAATDADNLLDEFAYEVLGKKMQKGKMDKVRSFFSSSNPLAFRFKMASKIKKIHSCMDEIFRSANQIGLRPAEIINCPIDARRVLLTDPFVDDSKIVGREDDVGKIVSQLTCSQNEKDLSVIGIVGMAGQGKTTVAQLLMKNHKVDEHFEIKIWTCVSDDFDVDRILKAMLQSLKENVSQDTSREEIVNRLKGKVNGKRFLLVLDDVWNENSLRWDRMNTYLKEICGSKESKIIVTTRNERVVSVMNGFVYCLGVLSGKASQELFEKIVFETGRAPKTPELETIGKRIVERCGGVPLALKAIGGLLADKRDHREWLNIEESNIGSTSDGVLSAIKLSFDHLPSLSLKQCFVYCSIFPKDSVIDRKSLIQLWMASRLLNPSRGSGLEMEDVGNNYFNILLQRSFFQEAEIDEYGNIKTCKMHDLVHDFALETSKGRCLTIDASVLTDNIQAVHLSIVANEMESSNISEKSFPRLRTLQLSDGMDWGNFLVRSKYKYLRVLIVIDRKMKELPISIAKLKHLRYLDISKTSIIVLPDFISNLYNLQILRLPFLKNLPKNFGRLVNLRHLYIKEEMYFYIGHEHHLLPGIGNLTSLRTLNCFPVSPDKGCQIEELCNLNHLEGKIRIAGLENVANRDDAEKANLSGKRNIESLELYWARGTREGSSDEHVLDGLEPHRSCLKALEIKNFVGRSLLPSWMPLLHNLRNIKLERLENCEQIPPLGHLPCIEAVEINGMKSVKCVGNEFYGWANLSSEHSCQTPAVVFPKLKELTFAFMSSLEEWSDAVQPSFVSSVELFPRLETLKIELCVNLTRLPSFLGKISSLRDLDLRYCYNLIHLPESLCGLTSLKHLKINGCVKLVSVPDLSSLRSLNSLQIYGCVKLVSVPDLSSLQSLNSLLISECVKLVSVPDLSSLRSLNSLLISNCKMFSTFPRGIEACRSLRSLHIPGPASCMESLRYLTNLTSLNLLLSKIINYCPLEPISNAEDDIQEQNSFATLQKLHLNGKWMPELKSLPEQIQCLTALRDLELYQFDGLEDLPEWLGSFHCLQSLSLQYCHSLRSFPSVEVMQGLTNLKSLWINNCPILEQRCEKESGAEWQKIAHIPGIVIDVIFSHSTELSDP